MRRYIPFIGHAPILGPLFRRAVAGQAASLRHVLTRKHRPVTGEPVWFASKQLEGEITWVSPNAGTFVFGSGTPVKQHLRFRYYSTVITADVVYDKTLHAWIVGRGSIPDHLLGGTVIHPDPVEVRLVTQGRH